MKKSNDNFLPCWYIDEIEKINYNSIKRVVVLLVFFIFFLSGYLFINLNDSNKLKLNIEKNMEEEVNTIKNKGETAKIEYTSEIEEVIKRHSELMSLENSKDQILIEGKFNSAYELVKILGEIELKKDIEILEVSLPVEENDKFKLLLKVR